MTTSRLARAMLRAGLTATFLCASAIAQEPYIPGITFQHTLKDGSKGPEMMVVRAGKFVFGGGKVGENPEDLVIEIAQPFAISTTEVTAGLYRKFLESTRAADLKTFDFDADNLPVSRIEFDRAVAFARWLSYQTGNYYSLPSSSEWEYAARAGTRTLYSWGDQVEKGRANCLDCGVPFEGVPAPVASFEPNSWGIFDMEGNVWEWTLDCMDPNSKPPLNGMPQLFGNCDSRELRGGSAESDAWSIRINSRASAPRSAKLSDVGIRVVMQVPHE